MTWDANLLLSIARLAMKHPLKVAHLRLSAILLEPMHCRRPTIPRLIPSNKMKRSHRLRLTLYVNARSPPLTQRWQLSSLPKLQELLTGPSSRTTTFLRPIQPSRVFRGSSSRRHSEPPCPRLTPCFSLTSACSLHRFANTQSSPCPSQLTKLKITNLYSLQMTIQLVFKTMKTLTTISSKLSFLLIFIDES